MLRQIRIKLREERLDDPGLSQCLPKEPDGLGIGNPLMQIEPQEPHEREPVPDLIFHLLIRQVIEG